MDNIFSKEEKNLKTISVSDEEKKEIIKTFLKEKIKEKFICIELFDRHKKNIINQDLSDFDVYFLYKKFDESAFIYWFEGFYRHEPHQKGNDVYSSWSIGRPRRKRVSKKEIINFLK